MKRTRAFLLAALLISLAVVLTGCGEDEPDEIVVSASSSLTDVFTELAAAFEEERGVTVSLNFASSSALATQIIEGAPADVFASANERQMQLVVDAGEAEESRVFAQNEIVVVAPAGRESVSSFEDLAGEGVRLVLAGPEVPVGVYAREAVAAASAAGEFGVNFEERVMSNVVSEEANVRVVLAKVELAEADAGIVYATDAAIAGDAVQSYRIPNGYAPPARYFIAVLDEAASPAREFVDYVLSAEGQTVLERYGFSSAGD